MGIVAYFTISIFDPALRTLENNPFVIGKINAGISDLSSAISGRWTQMLNFDFSLLVGFLVPALTLSILLCIDTLKTCVILDAMTYTRHNSNKEMIGQGVGNMVSSLLCGVPGAGTMGPTLVNINSGAQTKLSSVVFGVMALFILLVLGKFIAWIPISALAGVLMVVGVRMFDKQIFSLLRNKSTIIDFFCVLAVVVSAVSMSLVIAAGVGIAMAIVLFLRDQMKTSIVHRTMTASQVNSKKNRPGKEHDLIDKNGKEIVIMELQGQLFFGTTDQLYTKCDSKLTDATYLILDMRRLQSIDFTGVNLLKQLLARLKENKGKMLISSIPISLPSGMDLLHYMKGMGLEDPENLLFFDEMDDALVWAEDAILIKHKGTVAADEAELKLDEIELLSGMPAAALDRIQECVEIKRLGKNELVFKKNDKSDEIYFVAKGNVRIVLPISATQQYLLVNVSRGSVFGEMAFIDHVKRSADAITDADCVLFVLSRSKFEGVAIKHPEISGMLFERLSLLMASRIRQSNKEIKTLQET
jgi:SulP family sulfate permease